MLQDASRDAIPSADAIAKRRALQRSAPVLGAVERWWDAACTSDGSGSALSMHGFVELDSRLYRALGDATDLAAEAASSRDWAGCGLEPTDRMGRAQFFGAMFGAAEQMAVRRAIPSSHHPLPAYSEIHSARSIG